MNNNKQSTINNDNNDNNKDPHRWNSNPGPQAHTFGKLVFMI